MAVCSVQRARVRGTRACPLRFTAMKALLVPGCVIALLGVAAAVAVIEESRDPLIHEGDLVELMTAAYGVGGAIGLIAVWRARSGRRALCVLPATQHRRLFGLTFMEEALELTAAVALAVTCAAPLRARRW